MTPQLWVKAEKELVGRQADTKVAVKQRQWNALYRVFFSHWYPPKKLKYGKPRLGESTLT